MIVSTDSKEIADIAVFYGAEVPFLRPKEISGDLTSSDDVILHALSYMQQQGRQYSEVCKLQATSPLRNSEYLKEAYSLFHEKNADFLVSVCECEHSPLWSGIIGADLRPDNFISDEVKRSCRQDLPTYYRLNGAIYMGKVQPFNINKSFLGKNCIAYVMEQNVSIDIDSQLDFALAEIMIRDLF